MNDGTVVERRVESARSSPKHSPAPASQIHEEANITEEFEVKLQINHEVDEAKVMERNHEGEGEARTTDETINEPMAVDRSMDGEEVEHIPSPERLNEAA